MADLEARTTDIPFVDLRAQMREIRPAIDAAIARVLDHGSYIKGPFVSAFESEFASLCGARHGIACSNGTAAISLALEALGIGRGDEVITVAHTFAATAEAICHVGATPVFIDIQPRTYTMDVSLVEAAITPRTKAILPVHLYGVPADIDGLRRLCERHRLFLVEDAAQAHLARTNGAAAGTLGNIGCFSFYPGKNLGAYGDAGFMIARDADVADRLRKLVDHGRTGKYEHEIVGYNQRMDDIHAAVLSVKLTHLERWNAHRRSIAHRYDAALRRAGFQIIEVPPHLEPVYHLYVVEVSNRDATLGRLKQDGIAYGVHYPLPLHRQQAFSRYHEAGPSLPVTDHVANRVISLPICGNITVESADRVIDSFLAAARA